MSKFKKGESGNPNGRPRGASQAAKLRQAIENDLQDIIQALVEKAKEGDTAAAKLLLDRVVPAIKPVQQAASVDALKGKSLSQQGSTIIEAMGSGELTPEQAQAMLSGLASLSKIREADEIERRLTKLEKEHKDGN